MTTLSPLPPDFLAVRQAMRQIIVEIDDAFAAHILEERSPRDFMLATLKGAREADEHARSISAAVDALNEALRSPRHDQREVSARIDTFVAAVDAAVRARKRVQWLLVDSAPDREGKSLWLQIYADLLEAVRAWAVDMAEAVTRLEVSLRENGPTVEPLALPFQMLWVVRRAAWYAFDGWIVHRIAMPAPVVARPARSGFLDGLIIGVLLGIWFD